MTHTYFDKLDAVLRDRSKTDLPSKCQAAGFITQAKIQLVRKKLPVGSKERLLLSFYGECSPPVRNDLHSAFIHMSKCREGEARNAVLRSMNPNCILLPHDTIKEGALILRNLKMQDRANPICTTGDLAWSHQMRYELACNNVQETICSQKQKASGRTHAVAFSDTPLEP